MPRPPRIVIPGLAHHVTQRGNYRQQVFYRDYDRHLYMDLLRRHSQLSGVLVHAYCLMGNHVHLIVTPPEKPVLSRFLQRVQSDYARALHTRIGRVGHLWQARFRSAAMDDEHLWNAMVYVERNPVRAGLVPAPENWPWSSANAHLHGDDGGWLDFSKWRQHFDPTEWKHCLQLGLTDAALLERIRERTHFGWPLASEAFLDGLERNHGVQARPSRRGPKSADSIRANESSTAPVAASAAG
jgi:putative transposase